MSNIDTAQIFRHANGQRPKRASIRQRSRRRQRRGEPHTEHGLGVLLGASSTDSTRSTHFTLSQWHRWKETDGKVCNPQPSTLTRCANARWREGTIYIGTNNTWTKAAGREGAIYIDISAPVYLSIDPSMIVSRCRGIGPPSGIPSSGLCFGWLPIYVVIQLHLGNTPPRYTV